MKKSTKKRFVISGIILMLFPIFFALIGGMALHFLPRQYFAEVKMEIRQNSAASSLFGNHSASSGADRTRSQFVESQFQLIRSKTILYPVIAKLDLASKFADKGYPKAPKEIVYQQLRKQLDLKQNQSSNLIDIGVYAKTPQLAADIANEVAIVYQKVRSDSARKLSNGDVNQIKSEISKLQKQTDKAYDALEKIAEQKDITITISGTPEEKKDAKYSAAKKRYTAAKMKLLTAQKSIHVKAAQDNIFTPVHIWQRAEPLRAQEKPDHVFLIIAFCGAAGIPFAIVGFILLLIGFFKKADAE